MSDVRLYVSNDVSLLFIETNSHLPDTTYRNKALAIIEHTCYITLYDNVPKFMVDIRL